MSNTNKIVWIDDTSSRDKTAETIGADFIDVSKGQLNIEGELKALFAGQEPSLVIIDHFLNNTTSENPVFQRGSTISEAIKEHWSNCPVVGVTSQDLNKINERTRSAYDELFPYENIGQHLEYLKSLGSDFDAVEGTIGDRIDKSVALIEPPSEEMQRLVDSTPETVKSNSEGWLSAYYRWVQKLKERPGFLYDELWAATFIGLSSDGFAKVKSTFDEAKYSGVFSLGAPERWWQYTLRETLYAQVPPNSGEYSWHVGRRLAGVVDEHFSVCYSCKGEFPETVAYLDVTSDDRHPMHLRCTVLHPGFNRELYFEDIRMMAEE